MSDEAFPTDDSAEWVDDTDDRCQECGATFCDCYDEDDDCDDDRCEECIMYGDYQCSVHGEMVIAMMRAESESAYIAEALDTLLSHHDSRTGEAWERLQRAAREVRKQMRGS